MAADPTVIKVEGDRVIALRPGRTSIEAIAGDLRSTVWVAIVPDVVLAVFRRPVNPYDVGGFFLLRSDLSEVAPLFVTGDPGFTFPPFADGVLAWDPARNRLIAGIVGRFYTLGLDGTVALLTPQAPADTLTEIHAPQVSPDGDWIYFEGHSARNNSAIWRMRPDGSGAEQIGRDPPFGYRDGHPTPSPSANQIAVLTDAAGSGTKVIDLLVPSTRAISTTGVPAVFIRWAPMTSRIAFTDAAAGVRVLDVAGSQHRPLVTDGTTYWPRLDWSTDEKFVVATSRARAPGSPAPEGIGVEIIEVSSGVRIPIRGTSPFFNPVWLGNVP